MTATINNMNLVHCDVLKPDQLMENDIIRIEDEDGDQLVEVKVVTYIDNGYIVKVVNDYGEEFDIVYDDESTIDLFIYLE